MFYFEEINGLKVLKTDALKNFEDRIELIFTTKESCIKTKEETEAKTAKQNRARLFGFLKICDENLYTLEQKHTSNIEIVETKSEKHLKNTDGAVLSIKNTACFLNFADCTPVALYDPKSGVAAGLHAGWRGTAEKIAQKGAGILIKNFQAKAEDIIAVIGPCIDIEAFETGEEVWEKLKSTVKTTEGLVKYTNSKPHPDLAKINKRQLNEIGVKTVDISEFKTTTHNENFYSYRLNDKTTSRISMIIKLK